jgi:ABC-type cobalamin/Fe3+-siderophores transport system ATPase subunit
MYIKSLIYEDRSIDWKLEKIEFKPLTLLVGVSGVGKTQILKALLNLKNISNRGAVQGFKWDVEFEINKKIYKWEGKFEGLIISGIRFSFESNSYPEWNNPNIYYERLFINGELIIDRNAEGIEFHGEKIKIQLRADESIVSLLREEELIKDVFENFQKIIVGNYIPSLPFRPELMLPSLYELESELKKFNTISLIRNSNELLKNKLYFCYKKTYFVFKEIENFFIDIFPSVKHVVIDTIDAIGSLVPDRVTFSIAIEEKGVSHLIHQDKMSSGMYRTLMQIAELYLCADDSVILIDEFENSLGINCIDELTSSILASERNLQFIITSHHPYIINNIGISHWKIVTRNGSVVTATDAEKFGIGKSKHQAFTQLLNLDAYTDGVAS